jgi:hypothetical protein
MKKKYAFLVPVAVAVGALSGNATANVPGSPVTDRTGDQVSTVVRPNRSAARVDSFVLTRSPGGVLIAQHESHESHQSHESHSSHSSHESHSSHYSGSGLHA